MKKFLFLLILLITGVVTTWIKVPYVRTVLDRTGPQVSVTTSVASDGGQSITVRAEDPISAVNKISVTLAQGEKRKVLLLADIAPIEFAKEISIPLPSASHDFTDGEVEVIAEAFDAGFWSNKNTAHKKLLLDSKMPRVEVLSQQHVVAQGGAELLLLRAKDENLDAVGVAVDGFVFPAFQLSKIDPFYEKHPDLFGVLIALPIEFNADRGKVEAFATDLAGNRRKVPMTFRIARSKQAEVNPKLSMEFLRRKVPELLPGYGKLGDVQVSSEVQLEGADEEALIADFRLINEQYRALLQEKIKSLLDGKITPVLWKEDFIKPMNSATTSVFGEKRSYALGTKAAGGSVHYGLDLASVANDVVRASNAGSVLFAGELGIYGEAVVIDHGLGLSSLYGHLNSTSVQAGDEVSKGQEIGRSGQTGLAGGDHLHFEYRVNNVPVTPKEWWDPKWIQDHVRGKLEGLRSSLEAIVE